MKSGNKVIAALLCSTIIAASPQAVGTLPSVSAASEHFSEQLDNIPASTRETVQATIDFFDMSNLALEVKTAKSGSEELQIGVRSTEEGDENLPAELRIWLSTKTGKLHRLDVIWKREFEERKADKTVALHTASDFSKQVLGESFSVGNNPALLPNNQALVSLYAKVDDIPVQKQAAEVIVDANGDITSFEIKDAEVDENALPAVSDVLSVDEAKQLIAEQLEMELVYDDERQTYQFVPLPFEWMDAKTGAVDPHPYQYADETYLIAEDREKGLAAAGDTREMAEAFLGFEPATLELSTSRQSQPERAAVTVYTVKDDSGEAVIRTDENTGTLLSLHTEKSGKRQVDEPLSYEQAKTFALEFIEQHVSMKKGEYLLRERYLTEQVPDWVKKNELPAEYQVELYPLVDGKRTAAPSVSITIDLHNHSITSVTTRAYQLDQAAAPTLLSLDQAKQAWVEAVQLELHYVYPSFLYQTSEKPQLAYIPSFAVESRYVDAVSGKLGQTQGW